MLQAPNWNLIVSVSSSDIFSLNEGRGGHREEHSIKHVAGPGRAGHWRRRHGPADSRTWPHSLAGYKVSVCGGLVYFRVSDLHSFHADPDPGFDIFADPDPGFRICIHFTRIRIPGLIYLQIRIRIQVVKYLWSRSESKVLFFLKN